MVFTQQHSFRIDGTCVEFVKRFFEVTEYIKKKGKYPLFVLVLRIFANNLDLCKNFKARIWSQQVIFLYNSHNLRKNVQVLKLCENKSARNFLIFAQTKSMNICLQKKYLGTRRGIVH